MQNELFTTLDFKSIVIYNDDYMNNTREISFSLDSIMQSTWTSFKKEWLKVIGAIVGSVILFAISILILVGLFSLNQPVGITLGLLLIIFISLLISLGWANFSLSITRHGHASLVKFKTPILASWKLFLAKICYIGIIIVCLVTSLIPGGILITIGFTANADWLTAAGGYLCISLIVISMIYVTVKYQFLAFIALDYPELNPIEMLRKSDSLSKGETLQLVSFRLFSSLLGIIGYLFLFFGQVVTVPITKFAQAKVYEFLNNKS